MREKQTVEDHLAESLMEHVTLGIVAEDLADQMAESLANSLNVDADVAEGLAHLGCGPDEIEDLVRKGLTGLASRVARKLCRALPEGLPEDAAAGMGAVLESAQTADWSDWDTVVVQEA